MSNRYDPNETVRNIAAEIGDHSVVDWEEARKRVPRSAGTIKGLQLIERVAKAHRSARTDSPTAMDDASAASEPPLFTWGPLRVLEEIGEGGSAVVYRAWEPSLHRPVALKLRREDASSMGSVRWIEEARRLASVRHPNVLVIHGSAVHDDRAGMWTELIGGCTLHEWVRERGTLGAREAAIIVMDVCLALNAVHAAGLVHGDVKASNVMRESGGRLVLMDFGSGRRLDDPDARTHSGTPLTSAPELMEGEPATAASDVYSLGALLYWLVSERYPVEADSLEQLQDRLRSGESVSLRTHRPDLPGAFVRIVERALELNPSSRWRDPAELEGALAGMLAGTQHDRPDAPHATPRSRAKLRWASVAVFAVLLAVLGVWWNGRNRDPSVTRDASIYEQTIVAGREISVELGMVRVDGENLQTLQPGSTLLPGMRLGLELSCSDPAHVYLLNEDQHGELFVLFPVAGVDLTNPLAAGSTHVLPGRREGRRQSWVVTSAGGVENFLAIVSRRPLPEIERVIAEFRRASSDREVEGSSLAEGLIESLRGVGGMADVEIVDSNSTGVLEKIAAGLVASARNPDELWVWQASFPNPAAGQAEGHSE